MEKVLLAPQSGISRKNQIQRVPGTEIPPLITLPMEASARPPSRGQRRRLTEEQAAILEQDGPMKIDAVAGSGKTTTLIQYARTRPAGSRILYLAFNRSVKLEAREKFVRNGLPNVKVETTHSLAYRHIMRGRKLVNQYSTHELIGILGLGQVGNDPHLKYVVASHVQKLFSYYCNRQEIRLEDVNYLELTHDPKAKEMVRGFYPLIESKARELFQKMEMGKIAVTHDFYLKKYQLSRPRLDYDYILFDEGQDASPVMLDVFLRQHGKQIIVGDTHQQIYQWRHAVNSLQMLDFPAFNLTRSFRLSPEIADLARQILEIKRYLSGFEGRVIEGVAAPTPEKTAATLARTNIRLLFSAIEQVFLRKEVNSLYFEGNLNSYTFAEEGTSIYDVLHLFNGRKTAIRDPLLQNMGDLEELEQYARKIEDSSILMLIEIVEEFGNDLPGLIRGLKERQLEQKNKAEADMIFSTVHRCKGMEYDRVQLEGDFTSEAQIRKAIPVGGCPEPRTLQYLNQEINLLYVAATRAKSRLSLPGYLCPKGILEKWQGLQRKAGESRAEPKSPLPDIGAGNFEP